VAADGELRVEHHRLRDTEFVLHLRELDTKWESRQYHGLFIPFS